MTNGRTSISMNNRLKQLTLQFKSASNTVMGRENPPNMTALDSEPDFKFKQFSVWHAQAGMAVSIDGVLLGAWAKMSHDDVVLDIGTGTGLLSLMCAQRFTRANIVAIDIDINAFNAARANTFASTWGSRISIIHGDILQAEWQHQFDHIICNPPYFTSGPQTQQQSRATARHSDSLSHIELLQKCKTLLHPLGRASFILPITEGEKFIALAVSLNFALSRVCRVHPTPTKPCHRLLIELAPSTVQKATEQSELTIHGDINGYSTAFTELTKAFYLKM